ncbi:MAG: hypothetical protein ACYDEB_11275 [Dehalococcoidia bacterium]
MRTRACLAMAVAIIAVIVGGGSPFVANADGPKDERIDLAKVKAAVAKYHNIDAAVAAGWRLQPGLDQCFELPGTGGMGFHYINTGLLDTTLDPLKPEALVYQRQPGGELHLGAVEYIVPKAAWEAEGHTGVPVLRGLEPRDMPLHLNAALGVYVLHAWIFTKNPAGTFADWNPKVRCLPSTGEGADSRDPAG